METNYRKEKLKPSTLQYFKDCFDAHEKNKSLQHLEWQFIDGGVFPNSTMFINPETDKAIGVCAAISSPFKLGDQTVIGQQGLDLLVDSSQRNQGLSVKMSLGMQQDAIDDNMALVYSFPNGNSVHALKKYLKWEILGTVPFLVKPLKSQYFTKKIKFLKFLPNINTSLGLRPNTKGITITEKKEFPNEVDRVWKRFSQDINVALHRSQKYLNWRFIDKPNEDYKILHAYDADEKYLGFIVYSVKNKHKGRIGYVMEFIYDLDHPKAGTALLYEATKRIKATGADCVLTWCLENSPNLQEYKKRRFFNLPNKLRPMEINFAASCLTEDKKDMIYNRDSWYLSYADSDTV